MREKKYVGKLVVGMLMGMLVCNASSIQVAAAMPDGTVEMEAADQTISDGVYSSDLIWMTKTENGKKYKRLYDKKNKKWLTDWILCP